MNKRGGLIDAIAASHFRDAATFLKSERTQFPEREMAKQMSAAITFVLEGGEAADMDNILSGRHGKEVGDDLFKSMFGDEGVVVMYARTMGSLMQDDLEILTQVAAIPGFRDVMSKPGLFTEALVEMAKNQCRQIGYMIDNNNHIKEGRPKPLNFEYAGIYFEKREPQGGKTLIQIQSPTDPIDVFFGGMGVGVFQRGGKEPSVLLDIVNLSQRKEERDKASKVVVASPAKKEGEAPKKKAIVWGDGTRSEV